MRTAALLSTIALFLCATAQAQIPTATGRSFTLSDTAWKVFIPDDYKQRPGNVADVIVHIHGADAAYRNNDKYAKLNAIIITCNYGGLSSAYQTPFTNTPTLFGDMLAESLTKVRAQSDIPDNFNWDKIAVTSFSAGYAAIREILKNPTYYNEIGSMVLADTVYASYTSSTDHSPLDSQVAGFRQFALDAKNGNKTLIMTHTLVATSGYCDTKTTTDDILSYINVPASAYNATGLGGIQYYRTASSGKFKMYGETGNTGDDHLLNINYIGQWTQTMPIAHLPEPASMSALALIGLLLRRRR